MLDNETINEIRATRKEISARFGHSPKRLIEHYKEKQKTRMESNRQIKITQQAAQPGTAR
ncbi:MAG: hypothetical protein KJO08_00840 [Gammaproteobacteria bacterium]|nr:hypothetical protein [Gammaproteobacteria bacterium]